MSTRNNFSAREKNISKIIDCLPNIKRQNFSYRQNQDLPVLSANRNKLINRNINYSFEVQPYVLENIDRAGTPFSDFFSDSETGTPDFHSEESDSSAGSVLRRNTAEVSQILAAEWERIERTIYDEGGDKVTRPQLLEECKQWRELHPQLRVVGRAIPLPAKKPYYRQIEHDEIIAIHYSDYEQFSETEERLSQSSNDVTPQNSPRTSIADDSKLYREKVPYYSCIPDETNMSNNFCSLLQITPIHIRSPALKKRQTSSILKSEISSSKWMRNSRPDSSVNCDRNSAKSYLSLDARNCNNMILSASERNKIFNTRVLTARHREQAKLEPLYTPELTQNVMYDGKLANGITSSHSNRKVSLPPLLLDDEKKKTGSAKRLIGSKKRFVSKCYYQLDRRNN